MKVVLTHKDNKPFKAYVVEEYDVDKLLPLNRTDIQIVDARRADAYQIIEELDHE